VTATSSGSLALDPSLTTSWKTSVAPPEPTAGAVKLGVELAGFDRTTEGPLICVQTS
jgi:hypothetical protein